MDHVYMDHVYLYMINHDILYLFHIRVTMVQVCRPHPTPPQRVWVHRGLYVQGGLVCYKWSSPRPPPVGWGGVSVCTCMYGCMYVFVCKYVCVYL